jgi:pyruvate dehydrogenase E1 component alpha subunit/2-oxoisovalerate dehydrogenase E1 component alpha subunit
MVHARSFEEKLAALYRSGKIVGGVYVGRGQEAFSGALGAQLDQKRGDVFAGLIRDQAGRAAFGEPLINAARTYLGSALGPTKGRDGNVHRGLPLKGLPAMISHLGSLIPVVNGMLMAKRIRGQTDVVGGATIGEGGTSTGAFHEAMNQAAVEKLPIVIAVANNQYAYSTPESRQFACEDLVDRAKGYGVAGYSIDGTDPMACVATFSEAINKARSGEGPQMVVGKLLRLSGHGEHDDAFYVTKSVKEDHYGRDCIDVAKSQLIEKNWMTEKEITAQLARIHDEIEDIIALAHSEPSPNPFSEDWNPLTSAHLIEKQDTWRGNR